jgi:hypothetical protein
MAGEWRKHFHPERVDVVRPVALRPGVDYEVAVCDVCGGSDPHDHSEEFPDRCSSCGSETLWANWFGPDGFGSDGHGKGDRWATICADCGAEQG